MRMPIWLAIEYTVEDLASKYSFGFLKTRPRGFQAFPELSLVMIFCLLNFRLFNKNVYMVFLSILLYIP